METVQRSELDSSAANPVVKGMPSSLFVLSYEMEMQTGYADTFGVGRGPESGQSAMNVRKGLHSLMLLCCFNDDVGRSEARFDRRDFACAAHAKSHLGWQL